MPKGQTQPQHETGWCFRDGGRESDVKEKGKTNFVENKKSPSVMLDDKKSKEYEIFLPIDFRPVLCYPNHKRNGRRINMLREIGEECQK